MFMGYDLFCPKEREISLAVFVLSLNQVVLFAPLFSLLEERHVALNHYLPIETGKWNMHIEMRQWNNVFLVFYNPLWKTPQKI